MAKNKISEYSANPSNNTDVGGIDIAEGCAPSGINNAIRELMAQLKDQQTGADGDNFTVGGNLSVTGTASFATAVSVASGGTGASTAADARTNLGLGTIATQAANSVAITGGSITGITDLAVADGGTGASTLAANSVLLGNGTSALQTVAPSTSGNVLTSNGTTWTSAAPPDLGIGVGQSWQNVTGSRSLNTTYTNNTGKPIMVMVGINAFVNQQTSVNINGVSGQMFSSQNSPQGAPVSFIVPNGHTYALTGGNSIISWLELR